MVGRRVARAAPAPAVGVVVVLVVRAVVVVGGGKGLGVPGWEVGCCCWVMVVVGLVVVGVVVGRARTPGSRRRSSWKCTRAATRSLENSRAEWVRA